MPDIINLYLSPYRHAISSSSILSLLVALHRQQPKVGYFFLFYLQKTGRYV